MKWYAVPMAICMGFAGYMAINSVDGWGWFLFVGIICGGVTIK